MVNRFINFGLDKLIISVGLLAKTGFRRRQVWNLNLNQFSTNIISFHKFQWNRWWLILDLISILQSLLPCMRCKRYLIIYLIASWNRTTIAQSIIWHGIAAWEVDYLRVRRSPVADRSSGDVLCWGGCIYFVVFFLFSRVLAAMYRGCVCISTVSSV
jgi:hypothetical protein